MTGSVLSDRARVELAGLLDAWEREALAAQARGDSVTCQALRRAVRDLGVWRTRHVT